MTWTRHATGPDHDGELKFEFTGRLELDPWSVRSDDYEKVWPWPPGI